MSTDQQKEYIVTLNNFNDLDEFYNDMETPGGNLYIPDRTVHCCRRRLISRNTHYMLTAAEAEQIRNDPRVLAVELLPHELGMVPELNWVEDTKVFVKSSSLATGDHNWGLVRCTNDSTTANWGINSNLRITSTVRTDSSGEGVDVVIVDAHINPNHPEFAVNPDGTGGSRVVQYNWLELRPQVEGIAAGTYSYSYISSNHGTHVAGTVAGNTQGWARKSTIYYMEFAGYGGVETELIFDYLRAWHNAKPIDPITGRRRPTVVNNSWGYSYGTVSLSNVYGINYRGTFTDLTGLSTSQKHTILIDNGVPSNGTTLYRPPALYEALDADVEDAIADGLIITVAAGNSNWYCAEGPSNPDWNNYWTDVYGDPYYSWRGSSPGAGPNCFNVGAISAYSTEWKASFSNYGKRIDIWAPGQYVMSSVYNSGAATEFGITVLSDSRNSNYYFGSISGTSMATPQVTGILACVLSKYPNFNNAQLKQYITARAETNQQMVDRITAGKWNDSFQLRDSTTNILYMPFERGVTGNMTKPSYGLRPSSGRLFPRPKARRRG